MSPTGEVADLVNRFILPAASVVGTIIVALVALTKFRDTRLANIQEATTTWRELAESREAKLAELERTILDKNLYIRQLETRTDYLWQQLTNAQQARTKVRDGDIDIA